METEVVIETERGPDGVYRPKRISKEEKKNKRALAKKEASPDSLAQLGQILDGIERGIKIYEKITKKRR